MSAKRKHLFLIFLCIILVMITFLVFTSSKNQEFELDSLESDTNNEKQYESSSYDSQRQITANQKLINNANDALLTAAIVDIKSDQSPSIYPVVDNPPFELRGASGGRFAILNREGDIIRKGSENDWVFSIAASPNEKLIVVGAGDGNAYIIGTSGEKIIDLPQRPSGQNMLGMGTWYWLSDDRLLGTSGLQRFDGNGKLISCCGGDNISESKLYVYDMNTTTMKELRLPESIAGKVLHVHQVKKSGVIQVAHEDNVPVWIAVDDD